MEHYFSKKPGSKNRPIQITYTINNITFTFHTSSSVFSKDEIDKGTELLIKECGLPKEGDLLDIGCGYGPVGIILKKLYPDLEITMSDINERALALTRKNLEQNQVQADVIQSDLFENIKEKFDTILSNPPQHAGKKVCIQIIEQSKQHLNKGGSLQLVARHKKGGKDLAKHMEETFGNLETLGRKSGFHIYCSENKI